MGGFPFGSVSMMTFGLEENGAWVGNVICWELFGPSGFLKALFEEE